MADIFEVIMIVAFGISWPINIIKLWRSETTKGISVLFYYMIFIGYIFGIISKIIRASQGNIAPWYIWFFYSLNAVMVFIGILVYNRNRKLEMGNNND